MKRLVAILSVVFLLLMSGQSLLCERLDSERYGSLDPAAQFLMDKAERSFEEGDFSRARDAYKKFIQFFADSPAAPYAKYMIAEAYKDEDMLDKAAKEYEELLKRYPDSPEAIRTRCDLAQCYKEDGKIELALGEYKRLLNSSIPIHLGARLCWELGTYYIDEGKIEEGITYLNKLLDNYPYKGGGDENYLYRTIDWLTDHYIHSSQIDKAREVLEKVYDKNKAGILLARKCLNSIHKKTLSKEEKEKMLREGITICCKFLEKAEGVQSARETTKILIAILKALNEPEAVIIAYKRQLKRFPEDDATRKGFGDYLAKMKRYEGARAVYRQMNNPFAGFDRIADVYKEEGKIDAAVKVLEDLVEKYPGEKEALYLKIGGAYQSASRIEEAIGAYRKVKESPQVLFKIADAYKQGGKIDVTARVLNDIVKKYPEDNAVMRRVGDYFAGLKRWKEARAAYGHISNPFTSLNKIADTYTSEEKTDEAASVLKELIEKCPEKKTGLYLKIGYIYQSAALFEKAIEAYRKIEEDTRVLLKIVDCYIKLTKYEDAINVYREMEETPPILFKIADCYIKLTQYDNAISVYEKINTEFPDKGPLALWTLTMMYEKIGKEAIPDVKGTLNRLVKSYPDSKYAKLAASRLKKYEKYKDKKKAKKEDKKEGEKK